MSVIVKNNKPDAAPHSVQALIKDINEGGEITKAFSENAKSVHVLVAHEAAHNLRHYFEYAKIFENNESDALDLVQHAFEKSLENPDYFEGYFNGDKDPKLIILGHIQERLGQQENTLYTITQSVLENIAPDPTHTQGEIEHLHNIQSELAKTLSELSDEDAAIVVEYMENTENTDLPQFLKDTLSESDVLRKLHFDGDQAQKPAL
ncbi:MAG: hypothetical protein COB14_05350 [Alphaproteobacteria bacterium]|nr:MAG: hypothetical protein COB14_05350 [Alphaproteobacteria bacterium]